MFGLGAGELFIVAVLALVLIGPKKLPELARSLGHGLREFQKAKDDLVNQMQQPPQAPANDHVVTEARPVPEKLPVVVQPLAVKEQAQENQQSSEPV